MIDILNKIISGDISIQDAEQIMDEVINKFHCDQIDLYPQDEMCLNNYEWTAIGFGISLEVLAKWRKNGWPNKCANCGKKIDYKQYGWRIVKNKLMCIKCNTELTNPG